MMPNILCDAVRRSPASCPCPTSVRTSVSPNRRSSGTSLPGAGLPRLLRLEYSGRETTVRSEEGCASLTGTSGTPRYGSEASLVLGRSQGERGSAAGERRRRTIHSIPPSTAGQSLPFHSASIPSRPHSISKIPPLPNLHPPSATSDFQGFFHSDLFPAHWSRPGQQRSSLDSVVANPTPTDRHQAGRRLLIAHLIAGQSGG